MNKKNMIPICTYIPEELRDRARAITDKKGIHFAFFVRTGLELVLDIEEEADKIHAKAIAYQRKKKISDYDMTKKEHELFRESISYIGTVKNKPDKKKA